MLHYSIQTIAFQLFFLLVFDLFLKKETFFNHNRAYLLITALFSLVLPFIRIDSFKQVIPKEYVFTLSEVFIGKAEETPSGMIQEMINMLSFSWHYIIYTGWAIALLLFIFKLGKILFLIFKYPKRKYHNISIVALKNNNLAFSFFNYIFIGDEIIAEEKEAIMAHEHVHVSQKHSVDLLFFEVLRILFWYNPLIYCYQRRIANIHEFIADAQAIKHNNKKTYYENLLSQVFDTKTVSFINPFFKESLIKKRIIMLSKNKSKQINLVKYALLVPMVIGMLFYTSCETDVVESAETKHEELPFKSTAETKTVSFSEIDQVPIYPGCGGSEDEEACMSRHINKLVAQNFNLNLGKTLGLSGIQKISALFTINTKGAIVNIKTRAPHPELEKEVRRIINMIPKLKAGEHEGHPVNVTFFLPIKFNVQD